MFQYPVELELITVCFTVQGTPAKYAAEAAAETYCRCLPLVRVHHCGTQSNSSPSYLFPILFCLTSFAAYWFITVCFNFENSIHIRNSDMIRWCENKVWKSSIIDWIHYEWNVKFWSGNFQLVQNPFQSNEMQRIKYQVINHKRS